MIDDGDFRLSGDTIITMASPWLLYESQYVVNYITETEISLTVTVEHGGFGSFHGSVVLQKSHTAPCERNDGLAGKVFTFQGTWAGGKKENFTAKFDDNEYKTIRGVWPYVYLKPYIYINFLIEQPILIGELSNLENDTITYKAIR